MQGTFEVGGLRLEAEGEMSNVKVQMSNEIQISKLKIPMEQSLRERKNEL